MLLVANATQACCALQNFASNLAVSTPIDMYLFSKENVVEQQYQSLNCSLTSHSMRITFMSLDESWHTPQEARDASLWTSPFSEDYRRMGHWRLTFQMTFASSLRYKYILQLDDDSRFPLPVSTNLLQHMVDNRKMMAARHVNDRDMIQVILGAAELARYFLVTEQITPKTLYDYCTPKNTNQHICMETLS